MRKRQGRNRILSVRSGVAPTKERCRQNGGVVCEAIESDRRGRPLITRYRAVCECPLDAYRHRSLINEAEYRAGLRFHEVYRSAVVRRRRNDFRPTSLEQATMELTMHEKLLNEAFKAIPSEDLGVVVDVCAHVQHIWNPVAYEKLRRGLGHLAIAWHTNAIEVCEHRQK